MPTPKIGRKQQVEKDIESLKPTEAERAIGDYDKIVEAREKEKAALLVTTRPPEPPAQKVNSTILGALNTFAGTETAAVQARDQEVIKAAAAIANPLAERAQSALTKFGMLKAKYGDHVAELVAVDISAVIRRVPLVLVAGSRRTNHTDIALVHQTARELHTAFTGDFEDLNRALGVLKSIANSPVLYLNVLGVQSTEFRQAVAHVEHYLRRAEVQVDTITTMASTFVKLESRVAEDLSKLGPLKDIEAPQRAERMEMVQPTPPRSSSTSFTDFDPRDQTYGQREPSGPLVIPLGDGDGLRVGDSSVRPGKSDTVKTIGVSLPGGA